MVKADPEGIKESAATQYCWSIQLLHKSSQNVDCPIPLNQFSTRLEARTWETTSLPAPGRHS
jgi:hypothetical protein